MTTSSASGAARIKVIKRFDSARTATEWTSRLGDPLHVLRRLRPVPGAAAEGAPALVEAWLREPAAGAWRVVETVHLPPPVAAAGVLRTIFVRRAPHLDRAEFARHWNDIHAPIVLRAAPRFTGYVTNVILDDRSPWDGVMEQWYESSEDAARQLHEARHQKPEVAQDILRFISGSEVYETDDVGWPGGVGR